MLENTEVQEHCYCEGNSKVKTIRLSFQKTASRLKSSELQPEPDDLQWLLLSVTDSPHNPLDKSHHGTQCSGDDTRVRKTTHKGMQTFQGKSTQRFLGVRQQCPILPKKGCCLLLCIFNICYTNNQIWIFAKKQNKT